MMTTEKGRKIIKEWGRGRRGKGQTAARPLKTKKNSDRPSRVIQELNQLELRNYKRKINFVYPGQNLTLNLLIIF